MPWPFCRLKTDSPVAKQCLLESWHVLIITEYPMASCSSGSCCVPWWRHQMETFSALLAICRWNSPVPGEFPTQRPVTRSFDVFFDLHLNDRLSKQLWGWWFETLSRPLWRHCNAKQSAYLWLDCNNSSWLAMEVPLYCTKLQVEIILCYLKFVV